MGLTFKQKKGIQTDLKLRLKFKVTILYFGALFINSLHLIPIFWTIVTLNQDVYQCKKNYIMLEIF